MQAEIQGTTGLVPSNYIEVLANEVIVEGDDGMLYVHNEGMTGERGIDVAFGPGDDVAPPELPPRNVSMVVLYCLTCTQCPSVVMCYIVLTCHSRTISIC